MDVEVGHLNVKQLQLYERIQLCYLFDVVVGHLTYAKAWGKGFSGVPQNFGSLFMGVIIWGPPQAQSPALRGSALRRKSQKGRGKKCFLPSTFSEADWRKIVSHSFQPILFIHLFFFFALVS